MPIGLGLGSGQHEHSAERRLATQAPGRRRVPRRTLPSRGGDDNAPVTFVGVVDGTTVPDPPLRCRPRSIAVVVPQAPPSLQRRRKTLITHSRGRAMTAPAWPGIGDPSMSTSFAQYLNSYLFATDPPTATSLVFKRKKDATAQDVNSIAWGPSPLDTRRHRRSIVARFSIVQGGAPVGSCDNGVHTATSDVPFGLSV
jgi:hypothetical protein